MAEFRGVSSGNGWHVVGMASGHYARASLSTRSSPPWPSAPRARLLSPDLLREGGPPPDGPRPPPPRRRPRRRRPDGHPL